MKKVSKKPIIMTDLDLYQGLSVFDQMTRVAIITCLSLKIPPDQLNTITWCQLKELSIPPRTCHLINPLPRHISSELVFWSNENQKPVPLVGLSESLDTLIGVFSFDEFCTLFEHMIYIKASSDEFIETMLENSLRK